MLVTRSCSECQGDLSEVREDLSGMTRCVYCGTVLPQAALPQVAMGEPPASLGNTRPVQPTVGELLDRMRQSEPVPSGNELSPDTNSLSDQLRSRRPRLSVRGGVLVMSLVGCATMMGYGMLMRGHGAPPDRVQTTDNSTAVRPSRATSERVTGPRVTVRQRPGADSVAQSTEAEQAEQSPLLGPRTFKPRTVDELLEAAGKVAALAACEECAATGSVMRMVSRKVRINGEWQEKQIDRRLRCKACDGRTTGRLSLEAYGRLCHLAETATFVQGTSSDPRLADCRQQVSLAVLRLVDSADKLQILGLQAGRTLSQQDREHNGLVLAGTVQESGQSGELYWTQLVLLGNPRPVTVISWRPAEPRVNVDDRLLVLGSVVDNPKDNLAGYAGTLPQVVWGGMQIRVP